jgi:hypothetical protein
VEVVGNRATVRAADALPGDLLRDLAVKAGFELVHADERAAPVTVDVRGVGLEEAVGAILRRSSFEVRYSVDAEDGSHVLQSVTVVGRTYREEMRRGRPKRTAPR